MVVNTVSHAWMQSEHDLAARIESRRVATGMSKAGLARACGVTRQQVYNWDSGRTWPGRREMLALAAALETSVSYLYGETDDPRPAPCWVTGEGPSSAEAARVAAAVEQLEATNRLLTDQ